MKTVAQAVVEGNSHFYMTLEGDSHIYDFALPGMVDVVSYGVGDTIALRYVEGDPTSVVQEIVETAASAADDAVGASEGSATPAEQAAGSQEDAA